MLGQPSRERGKEVVLEVILENGSWETNEEIGGLYGFHMGCMFIYLCAQCQGQKR